jgi:hypothetical protein
LSAVEEIRVKLETRLHEIEAEIESLRAGLGALEEQAAAKAANPLPKPPARRTRKANGHATVTSKAARAELEQQLTQAGGADTVELARETGADYGAVLARIRELEQAGRPRS